MMEQKLKLEAFQVPFGRDRFTLEFGWAILFGLWMSKKVSNSRPSLVKLSNVLLASYQLFK
ncbi:hypothetical protein SCAZ3_02630 [Streptococcus canis FSL Z3-227]|uniref:Uncharacterized protein n=1 Tax=Streptococcus canis FSL Z3-227 TaxID=482234 RepID=A0AAV3FQ50_STRCB|nr:hypothetical protein SCAZ3_02630 [Streptococcus canis FSL Z3-227]